MPLENLGRHAFRNSADPDLFRAKKRAGANASP
jgi:hypothetical protein